MSSAKVAHVWVKALTTPDQWPGLVLDWKRDGDSWLGLVVYKRADDAVTEWVDQQRLTPVPSQPHGGTRYG